MKGTPVMPGGLLTSKPTWSNTSGCSATSAFFSRSAARNERNQLRMNPMEKLNSTMAQQIAEVASAFEEGRTGHVPKSVTVVLSDNTLVITLHEAMSPTEKALATNPTGAAQMPEHHRQLFANSADALREEIKRISGVEVREAAVEVEPATGTAVKAFSTGTVVKVFLLARSIPTETWSGSHEEAKKRTPSAHDHSQDADRHSKTRHVHSQK